MFSYNQAFRLRINVGINIKRWKSRKEHWAKLAKKKNHTDRALEYFDDFYKQVFGRKWASVRLGLLSQSKYCAVINNYSDTDRIRHQLQGLGAIDMRELLEAQNSLKDSREWRRRLDQVKQLDTEFDEEPRDVQPSTLSRPEEALPSPSPQEELASDRLILPSKGASPESSSALYDFVPATRLKGLEEFVPESQHYTYYRDSGGVDLSVQVEAQEQLDIPKSLSLFTFEPGNVARFPRPGRGSTGVRDYYLLDGSSVLPVLSLGLEPGDRLLDVCSAPGGKTLMSLQSLLPSRVVSNDSSVSRLKRLSRILGEFLYDLPEKEDSRQISVTNYDARDISHLGTFNKILVDVPCTTDRHSLLENDNNIFRPDRIRERIKIPQLQTEILVSALKAVEDGGVVVYSTCSLSPVQNDGVVQMALRQIWQDTNDNIIVKDMTRALEPYKAMFKFATDIGLRYGHLVRPYLPSNFGPMYFCKLVKRNKC